MDAHGYRPAVIARYHSRVDAGKEKKGETQTTPLSSGRLNIQPQQQQQQQQQDRQRLGKKQKINRGPIHHYFIYLFF